METRRIGENPDHALANLRSQPPTHYRQLWKTLRPSNSKPFETQRVRFPCAEFHRSFRNAAVLSLTRRFELST